MPTKTRRGAFEAVALALIVLCLGSCSLGPQSPAPWLNRATKVRAYASPNAYSLTVDGAGRMAASGQSADQKRGDVPYPVADGGWLSPVEVRELKAGLSFGSPPEAVAACCSPRHAFLFYGEGGQYLGSLTVCFECGCATMLPRPVAKSGANYLYWNYDVFRRIVTAHHLTPIVPPNADG